MWAKVIMETQTQSRSVKWACGAVGACKEGKARQGKAQGTGRLQFGTFLAPALRHFFFGIYYHLCYENREIPCFGIDSGVTDELRRLPTNYLWLVVLHRLETGSSKWRALKKRRQDPRVTDGRGRAAKAE